MFNIKQKSAEARVEDEGIDVPIFSLDETPETYIDENGEEKPITIKVAGSHSRYYRQVEADQRKRRLKPKQLTAGAIYDDNMEKILACTLDWTGIALDADTPVACTRENARVLYTECPWVYEQVFEAVHDHARFFGKGSATP